MATLNYARTPLAHQTPKGSRYSGGYPFSCNNAIPFYSLKLLKTMKFYVSALLGLIGLSAGSLWANNLVIGSPTATGGNLQFTIQWDNSWNTALGPANYDAVWVFVKRQVCGGAQTWDHALLSTNSANHSVTGGVLQVDAVADGVGVFVRRSGAGNGNIESSTVTLALQTPTNSTDNFQVFGIEMVFVPTGSFTIGDGVSGYTFNVMSITAATQAAGFASQGNYGNPSWGSNGTPSLPSTYPQGFNAFYCMKYEISQEQYVKYLNSLTFTQQNLRTNVSPASATGAWAIASASPNNARNGIRLMTPGSALTLPAVYGCDGNGNGTFNETADGHNVACGWLSWQDLLTYLDWAGLRPMTEMEYEKVCRGANVPMVAGEYAWGTTSLIAAVSNALSNGGQGSEVSTASGSGLSAYGAANNTTFGPLRCGFAATSASSRTQAGASYYGAMEMSGNVGEQCVGGYAFNYGTFNGLNGDGSISSAGLFNTANWPLSGGGTFGGVLRGGYFSYPNGTELRICDRTPMTWNGNQGRQPFVGGRGVRTP